LRLLAIPAIIYLVLRTTGWFSPMLNGIAGVTFGMPVGSMLVMFANAYDRYTQLSTQAVSLTTLGSLLTIPLMAWLL
ncbi:MAG TPA: transporter, partial [Selenomonas sp.]|nr:transporter [Selenomonas sp.]